MSKRHDRELTDEEIANIKDEDIDFSDIPELGEEFWKTAVIVEPEDRKTLLTLRLDPAVVSWFKSQGPGYQTRMNAVLRSYYEAQTGKSAQKAKKTGTR